MTTVTALALRFYRVAATPGYAGTYLTRAERVALVDEVNTGRRTIEVVPGAASGKIVQASMLPNGDVYFTAVLNGPEVIGYVFNALTNITMNENFEVIRKDILQVKYGPASAD